MSDREQQQALDLKVTAKWIGYAILAGAGFIVLHFASEAWLASRNRLTWNARGGLFTALLWAGAWFGLSFLLGFLFGVPKVLQTTSGPQSTGGVSNVSSADTSTPRLLRVNTNLEEISDWLTKILVGAGLTQLVNIPPAIRTVAEYMAKGMEEGTPTFSAALLVFFCSLGFLAGYLTTRMFISLAFARADLGPSIPDTPSLDATPITLDDTSPQPSNQAQSEAAQLAGVQVSNQLTADQAIAVSKAATIQGNGERALSAAQIAVQQAPCDARAHYSLALALRGTGHSAREVVNELEKARALCSITRNPKVAEDIYNSLIYLCLYLAPPLGYSKAIELGEEFVAKTTPSNRAIYINLACAYAQCYEDLSKRDPTATSRLTDLKGKSLNCIQEAIKIDPASRERLSELLHGSGANKDDDDLKVFERDPEFRSTIDGPESLGRQPSTKTTGAGSNPRD